MASVISIVGYPFLPARTGGQKGIALFYKYFSRWLKVTIVSSVGNEASGNEGYKLLNILPATPLRYINPLNILRMKSLIRSEAATHLVLEHPYYGWLGMILQRICHVKLVVHSHNLEGLRWKSLGKWWWRILWHYEKYTHRSADYSFFIQHEDMQYGIANWGLKPEKCIVMSYGFEKETIPDPVVAAAARAKLRQRYDIDEQTSILLFNGIFSYSPNLHALESILNDINPLLQQQGFSYRIIICGKDIPEALAKTDYPNIHFAGFVDDIDAYLMGADVFLNPIVEGGGIKTKLVEALGNNLTAVSVRNGAIGIDPAWCGGKLLICENDDWKGFADLVRNAVKIHADTPEEYFAHFYWGYSTRKAADFINTDPSAA